MLSLVLLVVGCALASTSGLVDQDSLYEVNHRQLVARRSRARLHRRQNGGPSALPDPGIKIVTSPYSLCPYDHTLGPNGQAELLQLVSDPADDDYLQCRYSAMTGSPTTCYYYSDGSRDTDASDGPAAANCPAQSKTVPLIGDVYTYTRCPTTNTSGKTFDNNPGSSAGIYSEIISNGSDASYSEPFLRCLYYDPSDFNYYVRCSYSTDSGFYDEAQSADLGAGGKPTDCPTSAIVAPSPSEFVAIPAPSQ